MQRIRFKVINKIRRTIDGKLITLFVPKYEYDGIKYPDGSVYGLSPVYKEPIELSENDILIDEKFRNGTKKK